LAEEASLGVLPEVPVAVKAESRDIGETVYKNRFVKGSSKAQLKQS